MAVKRGFRRRVLAGGRLISKPRFSEPTYHASDQAIATSTTRDDSLVDLPCPMWHSRSQPVRPLTQLRLVDLGNQRDKLTYLTFLFHVAVPPAILVLKRHLGARQHSRIGHVRNQVI